MHNVTPAEVLVLCYSKSDSCASSVSINCNLIEIWNFKPHVRTDESESAF
jgi:hypothetical protein